MLGAEGVGALSSATSTETILLLVSVFAAALLGYSITLRLGKLFAARVGDMDLDRMTKIIVVSLVLLVLLMSGIPGVMLLPPPRCWACSRHASGRTGCISPDACWCR